jgi:hypothetical protein
VSGHCNLTTGDLTNVKGWRGGTSPFGLFLAPTARRKTRPRKREAAMRLTKIAAFTWLTALASPAAAVIGPPIAYSTPSTIYLVNPDGTGRSTLYTAPRKTSITMLDLKPGGGELAIVEAYKLKVLNYDERGLPVGSARTIAIPCGTILVVDHHPTDGSIIAADGCTPNHIWRIAPGATAADPQPLVTSQAMIASPRWSSDGSRIYYETVGGIIAFDVSSGTSTTINSDWGFWDVTRTGDRLILEGSGGPTNLPNGTNAIFDVPSRTTTPGCTLAQTFRFGPGDVQMAYRTVPNHGASYVMVQNADCSGAPFRLTGKAGLYPGLDWAAP